MIRPHLISILFWILSFPFALYSQGITITGRIVDAETLEPLPYAHVFIDQTTIGTVTDLNGEYTLEHIENGVYKLVFSFLGYEMYYSNVTVNGSNMRVSARLIPSKEMLESVEVKGTKDKEWEDQLKQFNKVFFGDKEFAKDCRILNPWVLEFSYDKHSKIFKATATEPLQIENNALGYAIECTLQGFSFDKTGYRIMGLYRFEEVNTLDPRVASKWTRNRKLAYQNSLRYLFKSIVEHRESQNGFDLYVDKRKKLSATNAYFANELDKNVFRFNSDESIRPASRQGFYRITMNDRLEIHHTTQYTNKKSYRDIVNPVSWIEFEKGYVEVSSDGLIVNNYHITTLGEYNGYRVAAMLPINYAPGSIVVVNYLTKRANAKRLQERVHLHTDKALYYPGEKLWFKAYLNYANPTVRDSLSRVLYVELISPKKEIVKSKMLKLDNTFTWSEFEIPDDWHPGIYFLRGYTSWMKNYGPSIFKYHPIVIMNKSQLLQARHIRDESQDFVIDIKQKYAPLDSLKIGIAIDTALVDEMVNASISITQEGLSHFPRASGIKENLFFPDEIPDGTLGDFIYPLEYGFSISGNLFRTKKRVTVGEMTVIQGHMDSIYHLKTDRKGNFIIENLDFFGNTSFLFQARNKKGKIYGETKLYPRDSPPVSISSLAFKQNDFDTIQLQTPISLIPFAKDDTLPDTAAVSTVAATSQTISTVTSFADYVISEADLEEMSNQNIIDAILSRIPGLQSNSTTGKIYFRSSSAVNDNPEPLFVVDGLPVNSIEERVNNSKNIAAQPSQGNNLNQQGSLEANLNVSMGTQRTNSSSNMNDPASTATIKSMLGHITADKVSRVEVFVRGGASFGSSSSNGTILIYTKKVQGKSMSADTFNAIPVDGFAKPNTFVTPDVAINDGYTSTIFWNPSVNISPGLLYKISMLAPEAPGKYLVSIEGLSASGVSLKGSISFVVEKHLAKNSTGVNVKN